MPFFRGSGHHWRVLGVLGVLGFLGVLGVLGPACGRLIGGYWLAAGGFGLLF
jgi:hypothetical protein